MSSSREMAALRGLATSRGLAAGPVFLYTGEGKIPIAEYALPPGGEANELARLRKAVADARRDIEALVAALRQRTGREDVQVFECHLMMLEDPMILGQIERRIRDERVNAEAAVKRAVGEARAKFERMNDSYFRERVRDLDDVERRLLISLTGFSHDPQLGLKAPAIVVADDLTPSETMHLPREFVLGFATNGGSATSHVALLARSMGLPAVTGLGDVTEHVAAGETVLLDGTSGELIIHPDARTEETFRELIERQRTAVTTAPVAAGRLKDGAEVLIFANMHPGLPLAGAREFGARGIGLYRSEYLWLNRGLAPDEEEQFEAYRDAARFASQLGEKATITIRTLDIGGDKIVRGITVHETNPFLGNRSIRYSLSNPAAFRTQLRAILRASAYGKICMLFPMISCVEELKQAKAILEGVKATLALEEVPFDHAMPVGAMIEVPSAALNADALAPYVDFFSIGTNDLVQYVMAADRGNEAVAHLYQPTNPAVLELVSRTIDAARRKGVHVGVCGESASDPVLGTLWVALGAEVISMSSGYIPAVSATLAALTRADLDAYAALAMGMDRAKPASEIYAQCRAFLAARVPDFEELSK